MDIIQQRININLKHSFYPLFLSYLGATSLPDIPEGVRYLYINNNNLTRLPKLPKSLVFLDCSHNKLEDISELEKLKYLRYLDCSFNNLSHFPNFYYLTTFKWKNALIPEISNRKVVKYLQESDENILLVNDLEMNFIKREFFDKIPLDLSLSKDYCIFHFHSKTIFFYTISEYLN